MFIDLYGKTIEIKDTDNVLKPRNISQIKYWGFKKDLITKTITGDFNNLNKLISYLTKSNIPFSVSENCQHSINKILSNENDFQEMVSFASNIKNGIIDKSNFNENLAFLKKHIPSRELKNHQIKAFYHLVSIKNGANFSVPGSGKTTVVLSAYEKFRLEGKVNILFVVGPPACFGPWREEFELVLGKKPNFKILAGGNKISRKLEYYNSTNSHELYLTTFQTLLNDQDDVAKFLKNKKINAYLVIDEAHYIKQINGNWANAVLKIAKHSNYRCVLTGTPIPKSYTDLYNIFEFLWPNNEPLSSNEKARLNLFEENKDFISATQILNPKIGPLFYRVRKKELGLKPQKFNKISNIKMNPLEEKVYKAIIKNIRNYSRDDYLQNIDFVEKLRKGRMIRLRQCLSYTHLLETAIDEYSEDLLYDEANLKSIIFKYDEMEKPAKLSKLIDMLIGFRQKGEKVVIWANFIGSTKLIESEIKSNGWQCKKIIGETPTERTGIKEEQTREKIRNEFVNPDSGLDILLANPAACSESISLHKTCHNAVYYDLSYNCAQYLQSLDRIHRVGGSENQEAYYYFLQYENTIEPDILANLEEKSEKMYQIIEGDFNIYSLDMFEYFDEMLAYERMFLGNDGNI